MRMTAPADGALGPPGQERDDEPDLLDGEQPADQPVGVQIGQHAGTSKQRRVRRPEQVHCDPDGPVQPGGERAPQAGMPDRRPVTGAAGIAHEPDRGPHLAVMEAARTWVRQIRAGPGRCLPAAM